MPAFLLIFTNMIGLLILCLVALALGVGLSKAHYIQWGITMIHFKYPYFRLGLFFEPYTFYDGKGDVYEVQSLKIGLIIITIWIDFYTYKGNTNDSSSTTLNITTNDNTVITTTPII